MTRFIGSILAIVMILNAASIGWAQTTETKPEETKKSPTGIECQVQGNQDGRSIGAGGSFVTGLAGGVLLGLIGTGIAYVAQGKSEPPADKIMALQGDYCRLIYTDAYKTASKGKKRSMALWGGLLGTAALVVYYVASTN